MLTIYLQYIMEQMKAFNRAGLEPGTAILVYFLSVSEKIDCLLTACKIGGMF